jgi:ribosomal-protein-alanine N-acetyltransferase
MADGMEFRRLSPQWADAVADFFAALRISGEERQFHPHPLTADKAQELAAKPGRDLYYLLVEGHRALAYGMLRGWDEGYEIPALGIAVHPDERRSGLGRAMMQFLHAAARRQGAKRIRVKVYPDNEAAIRLYRSVGYRFEGKDGGQLVGYLDL